MAQLLAILTNDPAMLRCQLDRLPHGLEGGEAIGVGWLGDDDVLLTKKPAEARGNGLDELVSGIRAPALAALSREVAGGFDEASLDPFRFRRWLFAMEGGIDDFEALRTPLAEALPGFIGRSFQGGTDREHLFGLFLRELHEPGRIDDPTLAAQDAARALARAIRHVDDVARERGQARTSSFAIVATNGRILAAARRGVPLYYGLLEGMGSCRPCDLEAGSREDDPRLRSHRRAKAVALLTRPGSAEGLIEVPDGSTVAVGRGLDLTVSSL
ncbi:class II glutamine amidotransferase [Vulgatibacter incomptus]|uniref:Glutamine amidotransferase class-II n=1 Tax=Vulgatibacter incomptus TaxID=1391653 RepID=A0A0K1PC32_9BACT|nr:hypothetical protein [Vulgatibacter incomptus]AKU90674.1 Glutamine amidotransferase class-II [Vulgatibacter incomptus]